jgi:methyltransferase
MSMVGLITPAVILLALVTLERLAELWISKRNTARLISQGAVEHAPGHYPLIVLLHAVWLVGLYGFGWNQPIHMGWLIVFLALQVLRVWVLMTLGRRWTTRILVVPGETLVTQGPYKFLSHPNYAVVIGEIAVLPLCLGLPWYAALFSLANAAVLTIRIRAENTALAGARHE